MAIAAVVLAAGQSTRLGAAKQMARLGGQTLLDRAVGTELKAGLEPVFVVVSEAQKAVFCVAKLDSRVVVVTNAEAAEGMASSVRAGVRAAGSTEGSAEGVVLLACDQPAVTAEHLEELA